MEEVHKPFIATHRRLKGYKGADTVVEARIFVNKIPIYGDQHKAYTIMSRLGNILPVIRSCGFRRRCPGKAFSVHRSRDSKKWTTGKKSPALFASLVPGAGYARWPMFPLRWHSKNGLAPWSSLSVEFSLN